MENEATGTVTDDCCGFRGKMRDHFHCHGSGGAFYGLGFIGALVYYLTVATTLWDGILGVFKALFWPAFLVYGVLGFIGA